MKRPDPFPAQVDCACGDSEYDRERHEVAPVAIPNILEPTDARIGRIQFVIQSTNVVLIEGLSRVVSVDRHIPVDVGGIRNPDQRNESLAKRGLGVVLVERYTIGRLPRRDAKFIGALMSSLNRPEVFGGLIRDHDDLQVLVLGGDKEELQYVGGGRVFSSDLHLKISRRSIQGEEVLCAGEIRVVFGDDGVVVAEEVSCILRDGGLVDGEVACFNGHLPKNNRYGHARELSWGLVGRGESDVDQGEPHNDDQCHFLPSPELFEIGTPSWHYLALLFMSSLLTGLRVSSRLNRTC